MSPGCRIRGGLDARFDDFAENVGDVAVSRVGNTPPAVPEKMANLWVSWNQSNWQVQGGVRYVGSHYLNNANTSSTPSYTVADGGVRRRLNDRVGVDLRLYNLLDAFYGHSIYGRGGGAAVARRPTALGGGGDHGVVLMVARRAQRR